MKDPISTHWLPIDSKEALQFYLEADRIALRLEQRTMVRRIVNEFGITAPPWLILRYQRLLRKAEYLYNCQTSFASKPYKAYVFLRLNRLGLRLGFEIPLNVFGPGLSVAHFGTIIVNSNARVGANCRLHNLTHIAQKTGYNDKCPTIGDDVFIGAGARILGGITIADGTIIGANSVVTKSVLEPCTTVAGAPARKVSDFGTESFWRSGEREALIDYVAVHKELYSKQ